MIVEHKTLDKETILEKKKKIITWKISKVVIYVILAILVGIFAEQLIGEGEDGYAHYLIGIIMVMYGVEEVVTHLISKKSFTENNSFYWGVVDFILGFLLIIKIRTPETVYVTWAIWSILRETIELQEITELLKEHIFAFVNMFESILILVFSVLMLINPTPHHAVTHVYLLSLELTINSIAPLVYYIIKEKKEAKENHNA